MSHVPAWDARNKIQTLSFVQLSYDFNALKLHFETVGDFYRAALGVLMHLRGDDPLPGAVTEYADRTRQQIDCIWMGLFWDAKAPRPAHIEAQRHAFTVMNGLALERLLFGAVPGVTSYLDRLKRDLSDSLKEGESS